MTRQCLLGLKPSRMREETSCLEVLCSLLVSAHDLICGSTAEP